MPRRSLADGRVLLTGASSGIGRELALALARRGARLLLTARRDDLLESLCQECLQAGGQAERLAGDVAEPACRDALRQWIAEQWGALDVLVNNAGVSAHGLFEDASESTLRRIMEVNFFAATELARLVLPLLVRGREPAIVNMGSIVGHRGLPMNSQYAASKFALRGWTESVRAELAGRVDVLLVSPGTTDTAFFEHLLERRGALPWRQAKAVSAASVAEQTVRALERGRREIFPNWLGRALVTSNRLFPGIVDWAVARTARNAGRNR
jgi:short-subunit dehydrogenase